MDMTKKAFFVCACAMLVIGSVVVLNVRSVVAADTQPAICATATTDDIIQACKDYAVETTRLKELQAQLTAQKAKSGALQSNVNSLIAQISSAQSKIKDKVNTIGVLSKQITEKERTINELSSELDRQHDSMAQLIKRTNEIDQKGAAYVLLSSQAVTDFYQDLDDFLSIKQSLYATLNKVKQIKSTTEDQKQDLQDKQAQTLDAKAALEFQKKQIQASESQAKALLSNSKTEEQKVAATVAEQQKKVASIQSKLFSFAGGATKAIPFGDAYAYAKAASATTGVRPAFILAILKQESSFGANVGTCNRAGDPPSKSYKNVMPGPEAKASGKSSRDDQTIFLQITAALGLNPDTTPVSCPFGSGWGGGMGPTQFIPSTWQSVASRVSAALGVGTANPWNPRDAIMASAIYLKDRGGIGGETNERNAACKYYSGRACDGKKPANSFYGNSVMSFALQFQADIDYLEKYGVSRR
jgi:membrane-bound lytic murein transglycosylase B